MSSPSSGGGRKRSRLQMDATVAATSVEQGNHRRFTVEVDGVTYIVGGREPPPREYRAPDDDDDDEDEAFYRDLTVPAVEERVPLFLRTVDAARIPPFLRTAAAAWGRTEEHQEQISIIYKRARVPASSKAILGLEEVSAADAARAECAVCLQDFGAEDKLRAMPCSHAFHQECIFDWLRVNHVCPLCRHALSTQPPEDDEKERNYQQARLPVPEEA